MKVLRRALARLRVVEEGVIEVGSRFRVREGASLAPDVSIGPLLGQGLQVEITSARDP